MSADTDGSVETTRGPSTATEEPRAAAEAAADEIPAGGREADPLGSTQSKCSPPSDQVDRRRARWAARAALWQASTLYPVRTCGRHLAPVMDRSDGATVPVERSAVGVKWRQTDRGATAGYSGLTLCGSVWACPRCSAVVAAQRSAEIAAAVGECHARGGQVHFLTLTLRHRRADSLGELFDVLHAGWRAVAGSVAWTGKSATTRTTGRLGDRDRFGIAGYVRVIEATVSRPNSGGHGWHLHAHVLAFTVGGLDAGVRDDFADVLAGLMGRPIAIDQAWLGRVTLHARIAQRWARGVEKAGGRTPGAAAVDLVTIEDGGAAYVGRYLAKSTYDVATRLGAEIAAGDLTKTAREVANVSPFGLLAELVADGPTFGIRTPRRWEIASTATALDLIDHETGEATAIRPPGGWALWTEWEQATHGRRQLAWALRSQGDSQREQLWRALLDARGDGADATDEDIASREIDGDTLGQIARASWYGRLVWRPSWLVEALEAAERDGGSGLSAWMERHEVQYQPR